MRPFEDVPTQARLEIYEGAEQPVYHAPVVEPMTAWPYREEAAFFDSV